MTIVTEIADAMQSIFEERANELARETGFIKRQRQVSGSGFCKALVFAWLAESDATLEALSQSMANVEESISRQGLDQRFSPQAAHFLEEVLKESVAKVIQAQSVKVSILNQFKAVYVFDSTVIILPKQLAEIWQGCQDSALKISVCWDLVSGALVQVYLHSAIEHDQKAPVLYEALVADSLRLADLGYFNLKVLESLDEQAVYWITRYKQGTNLYDTAGNRFDLADYLQTSLAEHIEVEVRLGATQQIACRLIAQKLSEQQLHQRQQDLARWESRQQKQASAQRWDGLQWSIYVTNIPEDKVTSQQIVTLAPVRWQIELLFKLWKSEMQIDEWNSNNPWRILCEIYAKLIACIVQHWLMLVGQAHDLSRSMTQATTAIRHLAWMMAYQLAHKADLCFLIEHIGSIIRSGCRINSSATSPSTFSKLKLLT